MNYDLQASVIDLLLRVSRLETNVSRLERYVIAIAHALNINPPAWIYQSLNNYIIVI